MYLKAGQLLTKVLEQKSFSKITSSIVHFETQKSQSELCLFEG